MTKIYALFLPQFHADPFNDAWWGTGFTEWTNVKKARPLFEGHRQPRLPMDGYQMLESPADLDTQMDQARRGGVDGFVIYHYWSNGQRLLKKPLDMLLETPDIGAGFEFSLCWANHSWTRSWTNRTGAPDMLLAQEYEETEAELQVHVDFLVRAFGDPRYSHVNGQPVLFLYKAQDIPNLEMFVDILQRSCLATLGTECHVSGMVASPTRSFDFLDAMTSVTLMQPAAAHNLPEAVFEADRSNGVDTARLKALFQVLPGWVKRMGYTLRDSTVAGPVELSYTATWDKALRQIVQCKRGSGQRVYHSAFVEFDNTPRYGNRARYYAGFTPELFEHYLGRVLDAARAGDTDDFIVINAWNEWGEGMYLQPDQEFGDARLAALRAARASVGM